MSPLPAPREAGAGTALMGTSRPERPGAESSEGRPRGARRRGGALVQAETCRLGGRGPTPPAQDAPGAAPRARRPLQGGTQTSPGGAPPSARGPHSAPAFGASPAPRRDCSRIWGVHVISQRGGTRALSNKGTVPRPPRVPGAGGQAGADLPGGGARLRAGASSRACASPAPRPSVHLLSRPGLWSRRGWQRAGAQGPSRGRGEGHSRACPRAGAAVGLGPEGPGAGGARGSAGRGRSAGQRSGRGRVGGWSLRRSQAGLYCSSLRRPERAACAGDSARGAGLPGSPPPPAPRASQRPARREWPPQVGCGSPEGLWGGEARYAREARTVLSESGVPEWAASQRSPLWISGLQAARAAQERGSGTSPRRAPCPCRSPAPRPPAMAAARSRAHRGRRGAPP